MDILFILILGHLFGDYALQSDRIAENKKKSLAVLSCHVAIYVLSIWAFILFYSILYKAGLFLDITTLLFLSFLYIEHWIQDLIKNRIDKCSKQIYYLDQALHLAVLYIYRIFIYPG